MARLRSDIWVAAYLRRAMSAGAFAAVRRKGVAEAGAIFIKIDRLDGACALYGPAPQSFAERDDPERRFMRLHDGETMPVAEADARLAREMKFDSDLWIVEIEDKSLRSFLDDAAK